MKKISNPEKLCDMVNELFDLENALEEHVYIIVVDTKNKIRGVSELSHGGSNSSIIDIKSIFTRVLLMGGIGFFLIHNHPSGDTTPSREDLEITQKIKNASRLMDINFIDHLIVGNESRSMKAHGEL